MFHLYKIDVKEKQEYISTNVPKPKGAVIKQRNAPKDCLLKPALSRKSQMNWS